MEPLYILSVTAAHAASNLDEIPIIFALIPVIGAARAAGGYLTAQLIALAAAFTAGAAAAQFAEQYVHWLGFVPIWLGLQALWQRWRGTDDDDMPAKKPASFALTVLLFVGLATDSFGLMTAIFADSQAAFDLAALAGALISATSIAALSVLLAHVAAKAVRVTSSLEAIGPFVMIAVGLYVLAETPTDIS